MNRGPKDIETARVLCPAGGTGTQWFEWIEQGSLWQRREGWGTLVVKREACGKRKAGSACTVRLPSGFTSTELRDSCVAPHFP